MGIVGAGITGLSIARALRGRGASVDVAPDRRPVLGEVPGHPRLWAVEPL